MIRILGSTALALLLLAGTSAVHGQSQELSPQPPAALQTSDAAAAATVPVAPTSVNPSPRAAPAVTTPVVFADDLSDEPRYWYGWQILVTDGSAVTLLMLSSIDAEHDDLWGSAGIGTLYLGGPIVHAAHGNWGRAAGSLGLRLGVPLLAGLAGASMTECGNNCSVEGGTLGFGLGFLAVLAIDVAVFAYDSDEQPDVVTPTVSVGRSGGSLGIAGRF